MEDANRTFLYTCLAIQKYQNFIAHPRLQSRCRSLRDSFFLDLFVFGLSSRHLRSLQCAGIQECVL